MKQNTMTTTAAQPAKPATAAPVAQPASAPAPAAPVAAIAKPKIPKLRCQITGQERLTTREYLDAKIKAKNITEAEFVANYACKGAMKLLREGKSVAEIRATLGSAPNMPELTTDHIQRIKDLNGKKPKAPLFKLPAPAAPNVSAPVATIPAQEQKTPVAA